MERRKGRVGGTLSTSLLAAFGLVVLGILSLVAAEDSAVVAHAAGHEPEQSSRASSRDSVHETAEVEEQQEAVSSPAGISSTELDVGAEDSNGSLAEEGPKLLETCELPTARLFYTGLGLGECLIDEREEEEGRDEEKATPSRPQSVLKSLHSTEGILPLEQYKRQIAEQLESHIGAKRTEEELLHSTNIQAVNQSGSPNAVTRPKRIPPSDDEGRINYAAASNGAKVLNANKDAKSPNALLEENRDSYLRNPHNVDKWVIVELSEEALVDTLVLRNYEMYSSTVRSFRVYGSQVQLKDPESPSWVFMGTFEAEQDIEHQRFVIEDSTVWASTLLFMFDTHWGEEFYCTLSEVRVHGIDSIQTFKEEMAQMHKEIEEVGGILRSSAVKSATKNGSGIPLTEDQVAGTGVDTVALVDESLGAEHRVGEETQGTETAPAGTDGAVAHISPSPEGSAPVVQGPHPATQVEASSDPNEAAAVDEVNGVKALEAEDTSFDAGVPPGVLASSAPEVNTIVSMPNETADTPSQGNSSEETAYSQPSGTDAVNTIMPVNSSVGGDALTKVDHGSVAQAPAPNASDLGQKSGDLIGDATGSQDVPGSTESRNDTQGADSPPEPPRQNSTTADAEDRASTSQPVPVPPKNPATGPAPSSLLHSAIGSPTPQQSGDNIFKTLINKIKSLELNQSLFDGYVEDLNQKYLDAFHDIEQEIAGLEGKVDESVMGFAGLRDSVALLEKQQRDNMASVREELRKMLKEELSDVTRFMDSYRARVNKSVMEHLAVLLMSCVALAFCSYTKGPSHMGTITLSSVAVWSFLSFLSGLSLDLLTGT